MSKWSTVITLVVLSAIYNTTVIASCYEDNDKFSGDTFRWCGAWGTGGKMLGGLNGLDPIPYHKISKNGDEVWFIKLVSAQSDWSNINVGDRIVFLVDDELVEIKINNRSNRNVDGSNEYKGVQAVEYVNIISNPEFFEKLAQAANVEFALYTSQGRQERKIHKSALEHYADLIAKVHSLKKTD